MNINYIEIKTKLTPVIDKLKNHQYWITYTQENYNNLILLLVELEKIIYWENFLKIKSIYRFKYKNHISQDIKIYDNRYFAIFVELSHDFHTYKMYRKCPDEIENSKFIKFYKSFINLCSQFINDEEPEFVITKNLSYGSKAITIDNISGFYKVNLNYKDRFNNLIETYEQKKITRPWLTEWYEDKIWCLKNNEDITTIFR